MLGPSNIRKVQELMLPKKIKIMMSTFHFSVQVSEKIDYNDVINQINKFVSNENEV